MGESPDSEQPPSSVADRPRRISDAQGHFLIGLKGEVEDAHSDMDNDRYSEANEDMNSRTLLRTLHVELESDTYRPESQTFRDFGSHDHEITQRVVDKHGHTVKQASTSFDSQDRNKVQKLRVVVYASRPFLFTFVFQLRTGSLTFEGFYKSLHKQIAPLRRQLIASTAYRPGKPDVGAQAANIYDLVWDPRALTIHSTIPNISDPPLASRPTNTMGTPNPTAVWSRSEALSTHMMILNLFAATRADPAALEQTCKTGRGWWIVWRRIIERAPPPPPITDRDTSDEETPPGRRPPGLRHSSTDSTSGLYASSKNSGPRDAGGETAPRDEVSKEIFLIRKAGDHGGIRGVARDGGGGWADGASRLAQGIGVDTVRYVEGLLSLNR